MIGGVAFTRIQEESNRSTQYLSISTFKGTLIHLVPPLYISTISILDWQAMTSMNARTSRLKFSTKCVYDSLNCLALMVCLSRSLMCSSLRRTFRPHLPFPATTTSAAEFSPKNVLARVGHSHLGITHFATPFVGRSQPYYSTFLYILAYIVFVESAVLSLSS